MVKGKFTHVGRPTNTTRRRKKKNNGLLQMDRRSNPDAAIPQSPEKFKQHKPLENEEPIPSLPTIRPQLSTGLTSRNKGNANEKLKSTTFSGDRLSGTTLRGSSALATGGSASVGISCAPTKAYPVNTPDSDEQIQDHGIDNKGNGKSLRGSLESLSQEGKGEVQLKKSTPLDLQQMYGGSVKSPKRTRKYRKLASNKQRNNVVPVGALTINIVTLMDNNSLPSGSSAGSRSNTDAEHSETGVQTPQKSSSSSEGELHTRSSSQQQSARHLLSTTPSIYNALSANPQSSIPRNNQPESERRPFSKTLRANEYTTRRFIQIKRAEHDSKADAVEGWRNHPGVIMGTWGSVVGLIMTTTWGNQGRDKKLAHAKDPQLQRSFFPLVAHRGKLDHDGVGMVRYGPGRIFSYRTFLDCRAVRFVHVSEIERYVEKGSTDKEAFLNEEDLNWAEEFFEKMIRGRTISEILDSGEYPWNGDDLATIIRYVEAKRTGGLPNEEWPFQGGAGQGTNGLPGSEKLFRFRADSF